MTSFANTNVNQIVVNVVRANAEIQSVDTITDARGINCNAPDDAETTVNKLSASGAKFFAVYDRSLPCSAMGTKF